MGTVMLKQCLARNITGLRCTVSSTDGVAHHGEHVYADPVDSRIEALTAERDAARAAMDNLQAALAKGNSAASFFLAAWQSANRTIAELRVELAKERERTAEMLGAGAKP